MGVGSPSAAWLRLLSAVFGVGTVAVVYLLGRRLADWAVGALAAAIVALARFHVYHSQEVRMYSLLTLTTAVSLLALVRFRHRPTPRRGVIYLATALVVPLVHYFGAFALAAQGLYLLANLPALLGDRVDATRAARLRMGGFATAAGGTLFGLVVASRSDPPRLHYIEEPGVVDVAELVATYLVPDAGPTPVVPLLTGLFVGVAGLAFLRFDRPDCTDVRDQLRSVRPGVGRAEADGVLLAVLLTAVPIAALFVISHLVTPVFHVRYGIVALLGLALLVALGVRSLPSHALQVGVALLLVVAMIPSLTGYYTTAQKEQWRAVGDTIDREAESGDLVLVMDRIVRVGPWYYVDREDIRMESVVALNSGTGEPPTPTSDIVAAAGGHDRVWFVVSHASPSERNRALDALGRTRTVQRHWAFVGVDLYLLTRESPDDAHRSVRRSASHGE
jgi:4-amino-4-deoxy-L-arabinose transferase-like glycosyltransferase